MFDPMYFFMLYDVFRPILYVFYNGKTPDVCACAVFRFLGGGRRLIPTTGIRYTHTKIEFSVEDIIMK